MATSASYDVIFVGAGHNALVSAAYLTKAGKRVLLLDRGPVVGGWMRTEELTLPGFRHDTFSALHPIFVYGPAFAELGAELAEHGLRYVQGDVSTASSFPDGRSAVISTEAAALTAELARLGEQDAWTGLMTDLAPHLDSLMPLLGMDLATPAAAGLLAKLDQDNTGALPFAELLAGTGHDLITGRFATDELRSAVLPWLLHVGIGPQDAGGALWGALIVAILGLGNPAPVGGSGKLAEALAALVTAHGGDIQPNTTVDAVLVDNQRTTGVRTADNQEFTATTAVVVTGTPDRLYGHLLRDVPAVPHGVRAQAARYRFRRGCFQVNLALSARPHFHDSRLDNGGCHSLGRGVAELVTSVRQAEDGVLPAHPSISWHEPTALDPDRAPAGKAVARLQVLETPLRPVGDAADAIATTGEWDPDTTQRFADRIVAEAAGHLPGLEDLVLSRHVLSPSDIAAANPDNAGPGDHGSGHNALAQGFTQRPIAAHRGGYATAVPGLYLIGGATWPGPGISGSSGRAVAQALLAGELG